MRETGYFRGNGGAVHLMDLPLRGPYADQLAKGDLVRVEGEADAERPGHFREIGPWTGGPTPVEGGTSVAVDPRDARIAELLAELEALKAESPEVEKEAEVPVDVSTGELKRPATNAAKSEWVAWAVAQGIDLAEAEGMTKAELVDLLGEK